MFKNKKIEKPLLLIWFALHLVITNSYAQQKFSNTSNDLIKYIKLPSGITKADVLLGKRETKTALYNFSKSMLKNLKTDSLSRRMDLIVVFTDEDGTPILPDKENRNKLIKKANSNLDNELNYTFNSPEQPWSAGQIDSLNTFINDFYPAIKSIIGNPFFNITVNVRQDNTINYAGLYFPSLNEMVLYALDDDVFCHESIHSFRDDYIMQLSTYEEGMTRATEIEVFSKLQNYSYWDNFHSDTYDYFYEALNTPEIATYNGSFITNLTLMLLRYQLGSYIWGKAYLEDNDFLKRFNDSLYSEMQSDPNTANSESKLRNIFATIKPIIEGLPNSEWYSRQFLLNTSPSDGYKLYQRVNQFTIDYFNRDIYSETPQQAATINWTLFNENNEVLGSGNDITTSYGFIMFYYNFPDGYFGKIKIVASVQSPDGLLTDTAYRIQQYPDQGIFGVVEDANSGSISITPLDTAIATVTTNLIKGAFTFPTLENVRGRFRYVFTYPKGEIVSRIFTKDRSMYYLLIKNDRKTYWVGSVDSSWHNPLNWSGGLVPGAFSDVIINSANPFNCTINAPAICRSLELTNNVILTTKNNLSILH